MFATRLAQSLWIVVLVLGLIAARRVAHSTLELSWADLQALSTTGTTGTSFDVESVKAEAVNCSQFHDQYILVIDAGSTGSRIHIYRFGNVTGNAQLLSDDYKSTRPGLSFYGEQEGSDFALRAAESLRGLLDFGKERVPLEQQKCSFVMMKATAGLRLLGDEESSEIIRETRKLLEREYPFPIPPVTAEMADPVEVLDGREEGVNAWIAMNYLLGRFNQPNEHTAAVIDLGGASAQIVFEPAFEEDSREYHLELLHKYDHSYKFQFADTEHFLYQHSHLGFGLMEARKKFHSLIWHSYLSSHGLHSDENSGSASDEVLEVENPCIPQGLWRTVRGHSIDSEGHTKLTAINMTGSARTSFQACRQIADRIVDKQQGCPTDTCSFDGIHQPPLGDSLAGDVYVVSYFYHRTFPLGLPLQLTLADLRTAAEKVCAGEQGWHQLAIPPEFEEQVFAELRDRPEWCLDLTYIISLLEGYGVEEDHVINIADRINNTEVSWTLGVALPLVGHTSVQWTPGNQLSSLD